MAFEWDSYVLTAAEENLPSEESSEAGSQHSNQSGRVFADVTNSQESFNGQKTSSIKSAYSQRESESNFEHRSSSQNENCDPNRFITASAPAETHLLAPVQPANRLSFGFNLFQQNSFMVTSSLSESYASSGYESMSSTNVSQIGHSPFFCSSQNKKSRSTWSSPYLSNETSFKATTWSQALHYPTPAVSNQILSAPNDFLARYSMLQSNLGAPIRFESTPNKSGEVQELQTAQSNRLDHVQDVEYQPSEHSMPAKQSNNCNRKINFHSVLDLAESGPTTSGQQQPIITKNFTVRVKNMASGELLKENDERPEHAVENPSRKRKKPFSRTMITNEQRMRLISVFTTNNHPDTAAIESLSQELGLGITVVRRWFQNRRNRRYLLKPEVTRFSTDLLPS